MSGSLRRSSILLLVLAACATDEGWTAEKERAYQEEWFALSDGMVERKVDSDGAVLMLHKMRVAWIHAHGGPSLQIIGTSPGDDVLATFHSFSPTPLLAGCNRIDLVADGVAVPTKKFRVDSKPSGHLVSEGARFMLAPEALEILRQAKTVDGSICEHGFTFTYTQVDMLHRYVDALRKRPPSRPRSEPDELLDARARGLLVWATNGGRDDDAKTLWQLVSDGHLGSLRRVVDKLEEANAAELTAAPRFRVLFRDQTNAFYQPLSIELNVGGLALPLTDLSGLGSDTDIIIFDGPATAHRDRIDVTILLGGTNETPSAGYRWTLKDSTTSTDREIIVRLGLRAGRALEEQPSVSFEVAPIDR